MLPSTKKFEKEKKMRGRVGMDQEFEEEYAAENDTYLQESMNLSIKEHLDKLEVTRFSSS